MRILIFGDSITQGMWDSRGGWAQRLIDNNFARQMRDLEVDMPLIFNLGISADTTRELLQRFEAETQARLRSGEMAFVFAIGTNDARIDGDKPFSTPEQYAANIELLIAKALQFTGSSRIILIGPPPCDETRTTPVSWRDVSYTNQRLSLFDQTLKAACDKHQAIYVSIFEPFQKAQTSEHDLLIDGLHPNDDGHELMYKIIAPVIDSLH